MGHRSLTMLQVVHIYDVSRNCCLFFYKFRHVLRLVTGRYPKVRNEQSALILQKR